MKDLQKSALIVGVGASSGLGAAYGRRFAKAGYRVVLAGRSAEKVEASAAEIQADGGQARALVGDASQEEDAATFAAAAEARSEEHTSELQSLMRISYAVFCLKKKTKEQKRAKQTTKRKQ